LCFLRNCKQETTTAPSTLSAGVDRWLGPTQESCTGAGIRWSILKACFQRTSPAVFQRPILSCPYMMFHRHVRPVDYVRHRYCRLASPVTLYLGNRQSCYKDPSPLTAKPSVTSICLSGRAATRSTVDTGNPRAQLQWSSRTWAVLCYPHPKGPSRSSLCLPLLTAWW
jgi:hypothetical protein